MTIKHKFAITPEELVLDREISFMAKGLYAYLILLNNLSAVTVKGISMYMRENEDAVRTAALELEAKGYLEDIV